jgi:hypothetical protein
MFVENLDEQKKIEFDRALFAPPIGRSPDRVDPDVIRDELRAFRSLSTEVTSG